MAYDPNMNLGATGDSLDLPDWCHNEESFDLSNFISNNRNLELCNDDLFETLFPPNSPPASDMNKDKTDKEVEHWSNHGPSGSHPASACSSTATSPALQNYYNTPPVTPRTDLLRTSPHHLQHEGLTMPMAASRLALLNSSNHQASKQSNYGASALNQAMVKQEPIEQNSSHIPFAVTRTQADPGPSLFHKTNKVTVNSASAHSDLGHGSSVGDASAISGNGEDRSIVGIKRTQELGYPSNSKKTKLIVKGTEEYMEKRKRNNVAVRRSRDKAKMKALETQNRVNELTNENTALRRRITELSHELDTLKGLLTSLPQTGHQGM